MFGDGRSSTGRAADSKSAGWGFDSLRPCLSTSVVGDENGVGF